MSKTTQERHMKRLVELLGQPLGYIYGEKKSGPNGAKKDFLKEGRAFLAALGKDLAFEEQRVFTNPGGIAVSGEATLMGLWGNENGLYIQLSEPTHGNNVVLYRVIKHLKDYTGGPNMFLDLNTLRTSSYDSLVVTFSQFRKKDQLTAETAPANEPLGYYALERLAKSAQEISDYALTLPVYRKQIAKIIDKDRVKAKEIYNALCVERKKLVSEVNGAKLALLETGQDQTANYAGQLAIQLDAFNLMTPSYEVLSKTLENFSIRIKPGQTANASVIGHLMNSVKMGYYPTDLENISYIRRGLSFPSQVRANLLDPCCGEGKALFRLAGDSGSLTYGVELDESRATAAQDILHRVGFGSYFGARISREAFHLVFCNPPYLSALTKEGGTARHEKMFLIDCIPRLALGGVLVYVVPYYRLTSDICRILCDNFEDLSVYKFTEREFKTFHQVAVLGRRCAKKNGASEAGILERYALDADIIPCVTELVDGRYPLPEVETEVNLFKGAQFNKLELAEQLRSSDSFEQLFSKSSLDSAAKRPPLPLSIGQIGLIGGSGMINGLIECDYPHVIKGRIVKERRATEETFYDDRSRPTTHEARITIANKMEFRVLTPDGIRTLA